MGLHSSKYITSSSWSPFEGLELHGENKGGNEPWGPWKEEATLGSKIRKRPTHSKVPTREVLEFIALCKPDKNSRILDSNDR
jgi:hypothetical protein